VDLQKTTHHNSETRNNPVVYTSALSATAVTAAAATITSPFIRTATVAEMHLML
jgi:hypothetical protein